MRRAVSLETETSAFGGDWLLAPRPFDHWGQRLLRVEISGAEEVVEMGAENSACRGYALRPSGESLRLRYLFAVGDSGAPDWAAPDWAWISERNRHTSADADLAANARAVAAGAADQREIVRRLIADAAERFEYGHRDAPVAAGCDAVPAVCGLTRGSCLDINTYLMAQALELGVRCQYLAGYWFHPERNTTTDYHCWLAFAPETADGRALVFWDLAHAIKWADSLGAVIEEGLNPAGGRRLGMTCGRGLRFQTPIGAVETDHFAEPVRLSADGVKSRPTFTTTLEEDL